MRCRVTGNTYQDHLKDLHQRRNHTDKGNEVQEAEIHPSTSALSRRTKLYTGC